MSYTNTKLAEYLGEILTKKDIYSSLVLGKISSIIINERCKLHMNQKEFANKMGVSQSMISKWESGEYNFTVETLSEICEKLNMVFDVEILPENDYYMKSNDNLKINNDKKPVLNIERLYSAA